MSLLQLPAELVDSILSYLWADDRLSLLECSLTCRALVSPAQAYIFRSLKISMPSPELPAILEYRRHIRPLIQHLELLEIYKPWIQRDVATQRTFEILSPHVTSLKIVQRRPNVDRPRFELSCLSQLKCLEKISLSEELRGENFGKPIHGDTALITFFNHFPKLRAINFNLCLVPNQIMDLNSQNAAPIFQLEALKIRLCQDFFTLDWLVPATASLRNLRFVVPRAEDQSILCNILERMIEVSVGSLEHLRIRDLNLLREPNLNSLMIKIRLHGATLLSMSLVSAAVGSQADQVSFIAHGLQMIESLPQLRHLTLGFHGRIELEDRLHNSLDMLLVGTSFPNLCTVEICPILTGSDVAERSLVPDAFFTAFPLLVQRRMLSVRFTGEFDWN